MPFGRRALAALIAAPLVALLTGLLTMGARADDRPAPSAAAGAACTQRPLRFGVTDDPAEVARQDAFERRSTAITTDGFYVRPTPPTATLHAASHGTVVVFYRPDLPASALRPLHALMAAAIATKAPVIVAPRRQDAPLVALAGGRQLTCTAADAAQTAHVRTFASGLYPSLTAPAGRDAAPHTT